MKITLTQTVRIGNREITRTIESDFDNNQFAPGEESDKIKELWQTFPKVNTELRYKPAEPSVELQP